MTTIAGLLICAAFALPALILAYGAFVGIYCAYQACRRAGGRTLRLIDRAAYAVGIDSRKIAARWNERGSHAP